MKVNYILACLKDLGNEEFQIEHLCLYGNKPEQSDIESLRKELAEDEEFGMVGNSDYEIRMIERGEELFNSFQEYYKFPEEFEGEKN